MRPSAGRNGMRRPRAPVQNDRLVAPLIVNIVFGLLVMFVSLDRGHGLHYYPSTLLFTLNGAIAVAVAVAGFLFPARRYAFLVLSSYVVSFMFPGFYYGGKGIPGGDDGCGFGWLFFCGLLCLVGFFVGMGTLIAGIVSRSRSQPPGSRPSVALHVACFIIGLAACLFILMVGLWPS